MFSKIPRKTSPNAGGDISGNRAAILGWRSLTLNVLTECFDSCSASTAGKV